MGSPHGARPPSHTAYFVALGGVLTLLVMLLTYCLFFCLKRIKELATQPMPEPVKSVRPPPPEATTYPVQPVVRESATAMARLCKQIPPSHTDTVFPTRSPNKPTMLATPPRSPAHCTSPTRSSPARARSPVYGYSPARSRSRAHSPAHTPARAHSPARSPACAHSPARSPACAHSPAHSPAYANSPSRTPVHATRSPGSKPMPLPPPKIIAQSPGKKRPKSMPDQPTPAISVSEVK